MKGENERGGKGLKLPTCVQRSKTQAILDKRTPGRHTQKKERLSNKEGLRKHMATKMNRKSFCARTEEAESSNADAGRDPHRTEMHCGITLPARRRGGQSASPPNR